MPLSTAQWHPLHKHMYIIIFPCYIKTYTFHWKAEINTFPVVYDTPVLPKDRDELFYEFSSKMSFHEKPRY